MSVQFIMNDNGETTGVFIPINEWEKLKKKVKEIANEDLEADIPEWHKKILKERLEDFKKNPHNVQDMKTALDDIESEL